MYEPEIGEPGQRDGLLVGYTTHSSAVIWARPRRTEPVVVRYGQKADLSDATLSESVVPNPAQDSTVHITLDGLAPDTLYYYSVDTLSGRAAVEGAAGAWFRTAPQGPADFDVAFGSCMCPGYSEKAWGAIARARPSVFLMIGDHHYGDTTDLSDLRRAYRMSRAVDGFASLVMRTPTLGMWDDHDYCGDNTDGNAAGKQHALQVFREYWANPPRSPDDPPGTWFSASWGGVDFFVLDVRYWRNVEQSMLGRHQLDWLLRSLSESSAGFKVLVSSSEMHDGAHGDSWAGGHTAERDSILDFVTERRIGGVLVISGDRHRAEAWELRARSATSYPVYEYVSSPLASAPDPCPPTRPGRLFCATHGNFFGLLQFRMTSPVPEFTYEARDEAGAVVFRHVVTAGELSPP